VSARARECALCGHLCDREAEFHPYLFCVLKQAGIHDPWEAFRQASAHLGYELPVKPPLVRNLPLVATKKRRAA